ncbi:MaoC family dehydratase N-terminal domain-containing protein [Brevibacillus fluminis]|uniref:MaoC family dehydratase N-terminal domain-containing protein n=1 Tax=Brevibacillus fluminis TaxID=511487 RepID=UPI003F8B653C
MERDITAKVGFRFAPFQFAIERGKIKEFALAIGDENPIYYSVEAARAAGFRDVPIQPTFPTVIEMWAGADFDELIRVLELDPMKVLHGEQEYEYVQDIVAGDVITGQTEVTHAAVKRGMSLITLKTTFSNQAGEVVLHATSLIIERP